MLRFVAFALAFTACQKTEFRETTVEEAAALIEAGSAVAIDANTYEQRFNIGALPRAQLLALQDADDLKGLPLDKSKIYIFYCAHRL
jgi:rhodanese-related sulfurtransferase